MIKQKINITIQLGLFSNFCLLNNEKSCTKSKACQMMDEAAVSDGGEDVWL
jgi:hypothetical protein